LQLRRGSPSTQTNNFKTQHEQWMIHYPDIKNYKARKS
jgi:hypothetical protein